MGLCKVHTQALKVRKWSKLRAMQFLPGEREYLMTPQQDAGLVHVCKKGP